MITIKELSLSPSDALELFKGFQAKAESKPIDNEEEDLDCTEEPKEKKPNNVVKFEVDPDADEEDINITIEDVLKHISSSNKITLQSNFSRYNALWIGALASQGLITSVDEDGNITDRWKLTIKGMQLITKEED